jgi:hypothetical protein
VSIIDRVPENSTYVDVPLTTDSQDRLCVTLESGVRLYFEHIVRGTQQQRLMVLDRSIPGSELQLSAAKAAYERWRGTTKTELFKVLFHVWKEGDRTTFLQPRIDQELCLWIGKFSERSINTDAYTLPGGRVTSVEWVKLPLD